MKIEQKPSLWRNRAVLLSIVLTLVAALVPLGRGETAAKTETSLPTSPNAPAIPASSDPASWKAAISVGGFREPSITQERLDEIKAAGFDAVEFSLSSKGAAWSEEKQREHFRDFREKCGKAGLEIWSVHLPFSQKLDISLADASDRQATLDLAVRLMEMNETLGAKVFVIHPSSEPIADADRPAHMTRAVESLTFLGAEAAKRNIRLAAEDLPRTCLLRDSDEANELFSRVGENISLCFDSNHLLRQSPDDFLAKLAPEVKIATTHISDYDRIDERHWAPYEGTTDWKGVLTELSKRGYPGPFLFEGAGRPDKTQLSPKELFERWKEVRHEFQTGYAPARRLWPAREILDSKPVMESAGEKTGLVEPIYYTGANYQGKETKIFAYLGLPEGRTAEGDGTNKTNKESADASEKLPAVLLIHGGGGKAFSEWAQHWAERGYVALAMDLAGCGPDGKPHPNGGPGQGDDTKFRDFSVEDYRDMWTWQAIAAVLYGHALLKSIPDVDPARIAATGISWGGYLTSILSGVDPEIRCFVPVYGCGFLQENSLWQNNGIFEKMTPDHRGRWVALFDPSNHLGRATAPILWVNGTNDRAYPLDSYQKSYRLPSGPRTLAIAMRRPHGHIWNFPEVDAFIDANLGVAGAKPLLSVGLMTIDGNRVTAKIEEKAAETASSKAEKSLPVKTELFWTPDVGFWPDRKWEIAPATIEGTTLSADIPNGARCFFFSLTDDRGLTVSTEHVNRD